MISLKTAKKFISYAFILGVIGTAISHFYIAANKKDSSKYISLSEAPTVAQQFFRENEEICELNKARVMKQ
ncbi:MAG: hypothetical protein H0T84_13300 [Tatlockia sp.]|nr:hypothetical protein [Tatlockia sp.]